MKKTRLPHDEKVVTAADEMGLGNATVAYEDDARRLDLVGKVGEGFETSDDRSNGGTTPLEK